MHRRTSAVYQSVSEKRIVKLSSSRGVLNKMHANFSARTRAIRAQRASKVKTELNDFLHWIRAEGRVGKQDKQIGNRENRFVCLPRQEERFHLKFMEAEPELKTCFVLWRRDIVYTKGNLDSITLLFSYGLQVTEWKSVELSQCHAWNKKELNWSST